MRNELSIIKFMTYHVIGADVFVIQEKDDGIAFMSLRRRLHRRQDVLQSIAPVVERLRREISFLRRIVEQLDRHSSEIIRAIDRRVIHCIAALQIGWRLGYRKVCGAGAGLLRAVVCSLIGGYGWSSRQNFARGSRQSHSNTRKHHNIISTYRYDFVGSYITHFQI